MTSIPTIYPSAQTMAVRRTGRPMARIDPGQVRYLVGMTLSIRQIAICIGVSERTLFSRLKSDPKLRVEYQAGVSEGIFQAADTIMKAVEKGNLAAAMYYLRVHAGWGRTTTNQ